MKIAIATIIAIPYKYIFIPPLQIRYDKADKGGHCENDNNTRYNHIRFLLFYIYYLLYKYYIIFFIKKQLSVKRGVGQIALIL